jgi:hypothetical protein
VRCVKSETDGENKRVQKRMKDRHLKTKKELSVNSFAIMETNPGIMVTL